MLLRTLAGFIWLAGAGVLFGVSVYARWRARTYLRKPPRRWSPFWSFQVFDQDRYDEAGRRFIQMAVVALMLLPFWFLGGAALLFKR